MDAVERAGLLAFQQFKCLFICRSGCGVTILNKVLSLGEIMAAPVLIAAGAALAAALLGKKSTTRRVRFTAKKPVKVPVKVGFKTSDGKKVKFDAHKTVKKKVPVSFRAKRK